MLESLPLRRRRTDRSRRFRRGVYLLPSLFTVANLFCGYACVVYAMRNDFDTAALLIGVAMIVDTLDGFIARLTNTSSAFWIHLPMSSRSVSRPQSSHSRGACGRYTGWDGRSDSFM